MPRRILLSHHQHHRRLHHGKQLPRSLHAVHALPRGVLLRERVHVNDLPRGLLLRSRIHGANRLHRRLHVPFRIKHPDPVPSRQLLPQPLSRGDIVHSGPVLPGRLHQVHHLSSRELLPTGNFNTMPTWVVLHTWVHLTHNVPRRKLLHNHVADLDMLQ